MAKTIYSKEHKRLIAKLKEARLKAGLTQVIAGKLMGQDQTFISKVESGQYRVDAVQLAKFAKVYKKTVEFFIKRL